MKSLSIMVRLFGLAATHTFRKLVILQGLTSC